MFHTHRHTKPKVIASRQLKQTQLGNQNTKQKLAIGGKRGKASPRQVRMFFFSDWVKNSMSSLLG